MADTHDETPDLLEAQAHLIADTLGQDTVLIVTAEVIDGVTHMKYAHVGDPKMAAELALLTRREIRRTTKGSAQ